MFYQVVMEESYGARVILFLRCNLINVRWNTLTSRRHSLLSLSHEKKAVDCHYLLFLCVSNTIDGNNRLVVDEEGEQSNCGGRGGGG